MKLIRSFPAAVPPGRNYVVDDAVRLYNAGYDYRGLALVGDDVLHLDWDQAVSRADLIAFAKVCRDDPGTVHVVPTMIEPGNHPGFTEPEWNVRVAVDGGRSGWRPAFVGEPFAHLFGFGMLYLPKTVLDDFMDEWGDRLDRNDCRFNDIGFSGWYYNTTGVGAPIHWDIHCVHLHYRISEVEL